MKKVTPKQAKFARVYVETSNASEAYRQAYNVTNNDKSWIKTEACKVLALPNVAQTVIDLQERAAERTMVTVESITREYEEARQLAIAEAQPAAMNGSTTGKAKLHGLLVEKAELKHDVSDQFADLMAKATKNTDRVGE